MQSSEFSTIILKLGPLTGRKVSDVGEEAYIYRRYFESPLARYRWHGISNADGNRVFEWWPLKAGEREPTAGVHDD